METWCGQSLVGVDGSPLNTVGHTTLALTLNEVNYTAHFIVVDMTTILVARAVVDPHRGYFPVRLNFGDETVTLHENTKLGSLQTADIRVSTLALKQGERPTLKALSDEKYHTLQQLVNRSADQQTIYLQKKNKCCSPFLGNMQIVLLFLEMTLDGHRS